MPEQRICHRDIKADNILLTCANLNCALAKICDFGEVRNADAPDKTNLGSQGGAPEIETGCYDCKVDVWSLGVLVRDLAGEKIIYSIGRDTEEAYRIPNPQSSIDYFINFVIQPAFTRPSIDEVLEHPFLRSYRDLLLKRLQLKSRRNMILRTHFPEPAQRFIEETLSEIETGILAYLIDDPEVRDFRGFNQVSKKL